VIRAAGETETGTEVIHDAARKLAPEHRINVVLLVSKRMAIVDQTNTAIKFDAGREIGQPAVVDPVSITELETLIVSPSVKRLLEQRIQDHGKQAEILLDDRF
jgi:hypothetical protein